MPHKSWNLSCRAWCSTMVAVLLSMSASIAVAEPVRIDSGLIEGEVLDADAQLRVYRGIPYAAPPVGELRWRPPQPVAAWDGVRETTEFSRICPQQGVLAMMTGQPFPETSEDCLYLNVWTAAKSPEAKLPVMVWIHGGGLNLGWSNQTEYDGAEFAKRDVVLVSINYRLGPFGFLAHPKLSKESNGNVSGNYGFLDQIAALKWVQKNIAHFGGNPDNVTIFGESAGGTSVAVLGASPLAKGLFHRAIAQSPWVTETNFARLREKSPHVDSAEAAGEKWIAGIVTDDEGDLLAAMRKLSAKEMVAKSTDFVVAATVDGWLLPDSAEELYAHGLQNDVPLLVGTNADEGTMFRSFIPAKTPEEVRALISEFYGEQAEDVLQLYPVATKDDVGDAVNMFIGDTWFVRATRRMLRGMEQVSSPAFQYFYTRTSPALPAWGAHHAAELRYVFNTLDSSVSEADHELGDAMIRYWVQFATIGDPNVDGLPDWPAYESSTDRYLELGDKIKVGSALRKEACDVLDRVRAAE